MYSSPGFTNEKVSVFLARDLKPKALKEDDDEYIECEKISIKDLIQKLDSLELIDSKIIAGTLYLKNLMLNEWFIKYTIKCNSTFIHYYCSWSCTWICCFNI